MMASSEEMMRSTSSETAFCHDGTSEREKGGGERMNNDKKEKVSFICFLIASICFYFVAVVNFMDDQTNTAVNFMDDQTNTAVTYFCLGSAFLCLSTTHLNKNGKGRS